MKNYLLVSSILLCSCTYNQETNMNFTLEKECSNAVEKGSIQCKILNDNNLSLDEKHQSLGFYYMLRPNKTESDCDKSKYFLEKAAQKNNAEAYNALGMFYYLGCGVDRNYHKAEEYYLLAYDNQSRNAPANLGNIYVLGGYGIEQDFDKALKWFNLAIYKTPLRAYRGLAQTYYYLDDYENSFKYTLEAANLNDAESQHNLGFMYESGLGVNKDIDKAKYWYEKSAAQGFRLATNKLEDLSVDSNN